jgi:hypothetical protein
MSSGWRPFFASVLHSLACKGGGRRGGVVYGMGRNTMVFLALVGRGEIHGTFCEGYISLVAGIRGGTGDWGVLERKGRRSEVISKSRQRWWTAGRRREKLL